MRKCGSLLITILLFSLYCELASMRAAHAYIDPGTGSYVIQILLGVLLGAGVALRAFGGRIKDAISSAFKRKGE